MITTSYYFQNCRDGFNHIGLLLNGTETIATAKVHYINRTWEYYDGQTAMRKVCRNELERMEKRAIEIAKYRLFKNRACKAVRAEASEILKGWELYNDIKKHYETL